MRVWLVACAILFVLAEFYLWVKDFILPLPIYVLGGAFLAIASNYEKGIFSFFRQEPQNQDIISQTANLVKEIRALEQKKIESPSLPSSQE